MKFTHFLIHVGLLQTQSNCSFVHHWNKYLLTAANFKRMRSAKNIIFSFPSHSTLITYSRFYNFHLKSHKFEYGKITRIYRSKAQELVANRTVSCCDKH